MKHYSLTDEDNLQEYDRFLLAVQLQQAAHVTGKPLSETERSALTDAFFAEHLRARRASQAAKSRATRSRNARLREQQRSTEFTWTPPLPGRR